MKSNQERLKNELLASEKVRTELKSKEDVFLTEIREKEESLRLEMKAFKEAKVDNSFFLKIN